MSTLHTLRLLAPTLLCSALIACASAPQEMPATEEPAEAGDTSAQTTAPAATKGPQPGELVAVEESQEGQELDRAADNYRTQVEMMFANRGDDLNRCYLPELKRDPDLKGTFVVEFTVVSGGTIGDGPRITNNGIRNKKIEACVLNLVKGLSYPEPYNNDYATVKRTFTFGAF